jgi:prepilin-type N-terminal cleavage/methylation domain-containing protein
MGIRRNGGHSVRTGEGGFTIIELMIATSVLSVMLVMVTVMMINIGNLYYKGISQSRIQDNVRNITDEVSKHLELGDHFFLRTSGSQAAYCIGSDRYTFVLYKQIGDNPASPDFHSRHVLWRDANPTPGSCPAALPNLAAATPSAGGTELITPHSRLLEFSITGTSPYNVRISEAYGDNDLLCDTGTANDCTTDATLSSVVEKLAAGTMPGPSGNVRCRGDRGDQFCATANLSTTVVKRLP